MSKDNKDIGRDRYYGLERALTLIFLLVFALAIVTGILSFIRLNNIIDNVKTGARPDRSLILAKDIFSNLTEAENSVKSYSLTQREEDMVRFYSLTETTGNQMDELKALSMDDAYLIGMIDSLEMLVSMKFDILDQLLVIQDEYLVRQAMHEVMRNIRQQEQARAETPEMVVADTVAEQKAEKRESFFRRLFSKKNKKEEQVVDTPQTVEPPPPALTLEEISEQVEKAQKKALTDEKLLRHQELELFHQDNIVMGKIRHVLDELEAREDLKLKANILLAEAKASEVKKIIMSYGLAALVMLLLVALVIFIYIRRNKHYRKVLRDARVDAEELARQKEQFLANMSHEIRTPMNVMSGYLDQVLLGKLEPDQRQKLEVIRKSSDHLLQLLNNLLDLSKIQAGKLELMVTEFEPRQVISYMEQFFAPAAKEKGVGLRTRVDPDLPVLLAGDPVRLRQILFNLTSNAIKYTPKGTVTISVSPLRSYESMVEVLIEVADTGIGISPENQRKIFDEFEQVILPAGKAAEGSGLGLSITRRLVELLDGNITLESEPGKGSVFRLKIPFRIAERQVLIAEEDTLAHEDMLSGLRVLVADDEKYNRNLLRMILSRYHCQVLEAESGEAAIEVIESEKIDIIMMDIRMPGMSGIQAAGVIREKNLKKKRKIPVIVLSAGFSETEVEDFRQNGVDAYLLKPVEESQLIRAILQLMQDQPQNNAAAYDLSALRESSAGNKEFFREMLALFIENTGTGLKELRWHLKNKEWDAASELAHRISGPCRHLRAGKLHTLLKEIEENARSKHDSKEAAGLIGRAVIEFEKIRDDMLAETRREEEQDHGN